MWREEMRAKLSSSPVLPIVYHPLPHANRGGGERDRRKEILLFPPLLTLSSLIHEADRHDPVAVASKPSS